MFKTFKRPSTATSRRAERIDETRPAEHTTAFLGQLDAKSAALEPLVALTSLRESSMESSNQVCSTSRHAGELVYVSLKLQQKVIELEYRHDAHAI
jgi:hypothetical protein